MPIGDKPTNDARSRARISLTSCLTASAAQSSSKSSDSHKPSQQLVMDIEFAAFQLGGHLVNNQYFNLIRKCVKELNAESKIDSLKYKLMNGKLTVDNFVLNVSKSTI